MGTELILTATVINVMLTVAQAIILASTIKLWTEIVKAENIKRIGKV